MSAPASEPVQEFRDIRCTHSDSLPGTLAQLRLSVLISTYQTGHLVVVSARNDRLTLTFNQFERAMGVAVKPGTIAVCTRREVWFLRDAPDIAAKLPGPPDACFLARTCHFTDDIHAHEAAWVGAEGGGGKAGSSEFWIVNTRFSCLCAPKTAAISTAWPSSTTNRATSPPWRKPTPPPAGGRSSIRVAV